MVVDLYSDRAEIVGIGQRRYDDNVRWARGERYSPTPPSVEKHISGVRWEFAVSRGLGIEPEISRIIGYPRPKYDGIYRGFPYEAKGTEHKNGKLLYQPKLTDLGNVDLWFLAVDIPGEEWKVRLAGWIWERDMPDLWFPCPFDKSAWCIDQRDLIPVENLSRYADQRLSDR